MHILSCDKLLESYFSQDIPEPSYGNLLFASLLIESSWPRKHFLQISSLRDTKSTPLSEHAKDPTEDLSQHVLLKVMDSLPDEDSVHRIVLHSPHPVHVSTTVGLYAW